MTFSTTQYQFNHGAKPRGYGAWTFCPAHRYHTEQYLEHCFTFTGTFTAAKAAARKHFRERFGYAVVLVVCP